MAVGREVEGSSAIGRRRWHGMEVEGSSAIGLTDCVKRSGIALGGEIEGSLDIDWNVEV